LDLKKLSTGEMVIGISGIVLLIASFAFDWLGAKVESGPIDFSVADNAWEFTLTMVAVLIGIAMTVLVALKLFDVKLPDKVGNFGWGLIYLVLGGIAFLFVLIKVLTGPDLNTSGTGIEKTREIGIFIGLICTAGLAAGGYLVAKERGDLTQLQNRGGTPPAA
jgi:hypothetical protein